MDHIFMDLLTVLWSSLVLFNYGCTTVNSFASTNFVATFYNLINVEVIRNRFCRFIFFFL